MKALIDGDVLRYRIGFACETTIYLVTLNGEEEWGPRASFSTKTAMKKWLEMYEIGEDEYTVSTRVDPEPVAHCLHSVKLQIESILAGSGADDHQIFLTGRGNFRERVATIRPYKGNRPDRKPYHYDNITQYLLDRWGAVIIEGEEADDAMSYTQYEDWLFKGLVVFKDELETIICTIDKDLDMVPGWHYDFVKDIKYFIDEDTADEWFWCQMIMGDSTDNIQGIPGGGKKLAKVTLWDCQTTMERYNSVLQLYQKAYEEATLTPEEALIENARLLWMRRKRDEMWKPPLNQAKENE